MKHRSFLPGLALPVMALGALASLGGVAGCSSSSDVTASSEAGTSAPPEVDGGTSSEDASSEADATARPPGVARPTACPTARYKSLVIVGDSISDVGGGGSKLAQQPFYRTLLVKNDDATYPEWKGFDLATCWGIDPTASVVKASRNGAVATVPAPNDPTNTSILLNQATGLPATLEGPVLVVGTIGGNDVTAGLVTVLTGTPAQQQAKIDAFVGGFGLAMTELTKPDRFGAGVKADVLVTNVYDPSGGTGHFYFQPKARTCPGAFGYWPDNKETKSLLAQWNNAMSVEAAKHPGVKLLELNAPFEAHNVDTPAADNWFHEDCVHPSSLGHHAVRGVFWEGIVKLP